MKSAFHDHFSMVSDTYAQYRPHYPQALFDYLASLTPRHDCAWDCATGSGQAALPLAHYFTRVIAADPSARQLSKAARHPRLTYYAAVAEASALRPAAIDLITVAQALHWFDLPRFYAEVERVLRPGGLLAVWSYGRLQIAHDGLQSLLNHYYDEVISGYWPPERRWVEEGYRSLAFPYAELQPPPFALAAQWPMSHLAGYLRTWSATQRFVEARGSDPVADLERQLLEYWGDPQSARAIAWPIALRLGLKPR